MLDILDHHPNAGPGGGGLGKHGTHIRVMRRRKGRVVSPYGRGQSVASDEALRHYKHDNHTVSAVPLQQGAPARLLAPDGPA